LLVHFECPPCKAEIDLAELTAFSHHHHFLHDPEGASTGHAGVSEPAAVSTKAVAAIELLHDDEKKAGTASGSGRALTRDQHAGNVLRMREYVQTTFDQASLPAMWPASVICSFIFYHVRKDHVWSVVDHYMSTLRRWVRHHAALIQVPEETLMASINSLRVRSVLAYAKDQMIHQKKIRVPVTAMELRASLAVIFDNVPSASLTPAALAESALMPTPELSEERRNALMDAWIDIHLFMTFCRRAALSAVSYTYEAFELTHWSEQQLEQLPTETEWHSSIDDDGDLSIMVVGSKEKNFHARNKSKRFFRNNNVTGIPVASYVIWIAQQLRMVRGPLFRRGDGRAFTKSDWGAYLDRFAWRTKFTRTLLGTTSFRRGLATLLRERNVSEADIQFLGYWFSASGPSKYTGAARMARLRVLSAHTTNQLDTPARQWGDPRPGYGSTVRS
jgi:hypothetical protein